MARKRKWDPNHKGGKRRQAHFMDAALDGYIRDIALRIHRTFDDLREAYGDDAPRALEELGAFGGAGDYQGLWREAWRTQVWPGPPEPTTPLFGQIELAVREAILRERDLRKEREDGTIEDTPGYQEFVGRAMGRLLEEASGEIEEMD